MNRENLRAEDAARISLRLALIVLGVFIVVLGVFFFFLGRQGTAYSKPSALRALACALPLVVIGGLLVASSRRLALRFYWPERPAPEDIARIFLRLTLIVLGAAVVVLGVVFFFIFVLSAQMMTCNAGPTTVQVLSYALPLLVIGGLLITFSRWLAVQLYWPERLVARPRTQPDLDPPAACPCCGLSYNPDDYDADVPAWLCGRCGARLGP